MVAILSRGDELKDMDKIGWCQSTTKTQQSANYVHNSWEVL